VGFVRQTQHQPDKPHPNPVEGRGAFGGSPRQTVRITKAPPPPCFAWSPSPCRGGISPLPHASHGPAVAPQRLRLPRAGEELPPLLFRGGEEPRSGGGVGFVRQTQHQPDKPHPNPVEGGGAFRVSPHQTVRITKAPLHHASHGPAVAPQRLRLPRAGEELPPSPMLRMVPLLLRNACGSPVPGRNWGLIPPRYRGGFWGNSSPVRGGY
jgi:hypothetical protein